MQSPVPFLPDNNITHFNALSPFLAPLPPPGKRKPPAPPNFSFGQFEEKLPACGGGTMTIFGSSNRSGHMAGAGHTAAGVVRRSTAPSPPQSYLDPTWSYPAADGINSHRPPTSSVNFPEADGLNGHRPPTSSVNVGVRTDERSRTFCESNQKDSLDGSRTDERRSGSHQTSFNGRKSTENFHTNLEDENRFLREENSRLQSDAIAAFHRRPMAAIAGGGFRGPTNNIPKQCMCDSLRSKLARTRQELRDAREQRLPSQGGYSMDVRDNEAQTSPKLAKASEVPPAYQPPMTAPVIISGAARVLSSAVRCRSLVNSVTQTDGKVTADASSQIVYSTSHVAAQTAFPTVELGVQAGCGIPKPENAETQTVMVPAPQLLDTASQATAHGSEAATQVGQPPPAEPVWRQTGSQTETPAVPAVPAASEAEVQATAEAIATSTQTATPVMADVGCEAKIEKVKVKNSCSAASQTIPPARCVAGVQTRAPSKGTAIATQVTPAAGVDRGCQAEDGRLEAALKCQAVHEEKIAKLEALVAQLNSEKEVLKADIFTSKETAEAFQHMVQTKAFGQMNVTILCPRAECTVSGERIEMDSWNPKRLREEFEREVLPRFTRVFVEEVNASKGSKARSDAVDRAMQDFAETFRERLSAMLSAPNAAAAVQAAAATKGIVKSGSR